MSKKFWLYQILLYFCQKLIDYEKHTHITNR